MPSLNWKLVPKNIVMMDSCTHRTIFLCYSWCKSRTVQRTHIIFHYFLLSECNLILFTRYFLPYRARIFNNHMCMCECFSRISKLCLTEGMMIRTQMGLCDNTTLSLSFLIFDIYICCADDPEIDVHLWLFPCALQAHLRVSLSVNRGSLCRFEF